MKNRMLEIGTSGSVRGRGGNIPTYSASEATAFEAVEYSQREAPTMTLAVLAELPTILL